MTTALKPPPCNQPAPLRILPADADASDYLGDGIEAEWVCCGFSTPLGDCPRYTVSFAPEEVWLDVTEQTDFCYQFAVDNPRKHYWLVPVTINVNPGRYPSLPGEVMLRATCAEVVMVGERTIARFELEWRG